MKKIKQKDILCILLLLVIVFFAFKGYNSKNGVKDITNKFTQVQEIQKEISKKYSFYTKDDIKITIKKSFPFAHYYININYTFNKDETIENRIKAALYTIDKIDSLIEENKKVSYQVRLEVRQQQLSYNDSNELQEITIHANSEKKSKDRKQLEWSSSYISNSDKKTEITNLIHDTIKLWYNYNQ